MSEYSQFDALKAFLDDKPQILYIHYHIVDLFGLLRVRVVPKAKCLDMALRTIPKSVGVYSLMGHANATKLPLEYRQGQDTWWPDWTSIRALDEKNASVMCCISQEDAHHRFKNLAKPFQHCPRTIFLETVDVMHKEHDVNVMLGFELEFYLVDVEMDPHQTQPVAVTPDTLLSLGPMNCWSGATYMRHDGAACLVACVEALAAAGIGVEQFHAEVSPQQYEISLTPMPARTAIDAAVQSIEIVKRTALVHLKRAIFHPSPFSGYSTSGLHVHISLEPSNIHGSLDLAFAEHFLAGIMQRVHLLCVLGMPVDKCYETKIPHEFEWIAWGTQNRHVPVRAIKPYHWELRFIDVTSNPYLVVASCIAAGLLGVRSEAALTHKDCLDDPNRLSAEERHEAGVNRRLPTKHAEASRVFDEDCMGLDLFIGDPMLSFYRLAQKCVPPVAQDQWEKYLLAVY